ARLETFADGVFAIAATLLILNVDSQIGDETGSLGPRLLHLWPSDGANAVSFVTIGIMWINHHQVMDQIDKCDRRFLLGTVGLLLCIGSVPFPARRVAEHLRDDQLQPAALTYGFTMTTTAILFNFVWFYGARGSRLLRDDSNP